MITQYFPFGKALQDGQSLDNALGYPVWSLSAPITALNGGSRQTSPKITETIAKVISASPAAGVTLPVALPGKLILLLNTTAFDLTVFSDDPSQIDGVSGDTGVTIAALSMTLFVGESTRKWAYSILALYTAPARYFLSAYSTQTQVNTDNTARQLMTFDVVDSANGVNIHNSTQITVSQTGIYNIQFSAQLDKTDSGLDNVEIWLMKNGQDVDWTNTSVDANGNNAKVVAAWNFLLSLSAGDYVELAWWSADTNLRMFARSAQTAVPGTSPDRPAIPSVILTVEGV